MNVKLVHPKATAVLVIDVQNAYCSNKGGVARLGGHKVKHFGKLVPKIENFVNIARKVGLTIIFTKMIEDSKYMNENARIKMKTEGIKAVSSPGTFDFQYFKLKPLKGDFEIIKKSYDVFTNSKLQELLKKKEIKNIIILGAYTDVCVDTIIRSAFSKGYNIIVPRDLVSTVAERLKHQNNLLKIWGKFFAHILNSKEIIDLWRKT